MTGVEVVLPTDLLAEARHAAPALLVLLGLQIADYALGVLRAWTAGKIRSSRMRKGLATKAGGLITVCALGLVDVLLPFPAMLLGAGALCIYEAISVLENAARLGVRVPAGIVRALDEAAHTLDDYERGDDEKPGTRAA
jgi:toxin secretion/phage lysis holin